MNKLGRTVGIGERASVFTTARARVIAVRRREPGPAVALGQIVALAVTVAVSRATFTAYRRYGDAALADAHLLVAAAGAVRH